MKSSVLNVAAALCLTWPAWASELVITNETQTYDEAFDIPFTDARNLLMVGEDGQVVCHKGMTIGWSNNVTSAYNTDATNVFTVSDGGRFVFDNGGVASTSYGFLFGTWTAPKRRSIVTITGADTVVDLRDAYRSQFNGNTSVEISDGATFYMGKYGGLGYSIATTTATTAYETLMTISGDDTQIYLPPNGVFYVGHGSAYPSNRVVMTGGSIEPLNPTSGSGSVALRIASQTDAPQSYKDQKKIAHGVFEMQGGTVNLWWTGANTVNNHVYIGPGNGEFKMSGGTLTCGDFCIGQNQPGNFFEGGKTHVQRLHMTGGKINCQRLYLGSSNKNTTFQYQEAHIDLDGGVLEAGQMKFSYSFIENGDDAHAYLTANGGKLWATAGNNILKFFDTAKLGPKGLTIGSNGFAPSVTQSFSNKDGEEGLLVFSGTGTTTFTPDRYCTVSKVVLEGGKLKTATNSTWETTLVITNGATFSLAGTPTTLTLDGLIVPNGTFELNVGDKIHLTTDNVDLSGLKVNFTSTPTSGTDYDFLEFDGDVTGSAKVRSALRFASGSNTVSGNHATFTLIYDEGTGKTTAKIAYKPDSAALSDETVWNGPSWDASGWSAGVPTAAKVAAFSNASAPTAVAVPAGAEVGAISVSSGADYVLTGDGLEIPGEKDGSWLGVTAGSATFGLPIGLLYSLPVTLATGTSATFREPITGGGLVKTGKGALTLGADNTFRYAVSVGGGLNTVASAGALDNVTGSATLTDDTLVFTNSVNDAEMGVSTPVVLRSATSTTNAVVIKADSDVRLEDLTVSGGALIKRGEGRLTVVASSTKSTVLQAGYGPTKDSGGQNYRVVTSSLVDFAADGTAPAPEGRQYAGFNVAEGELVIEGDTNTSKQVDLATGCCIGMNVAGDASTFAQPVLTVDGANVNCGKHATFGISQCGADGCAVASPALRVLNGGKITFGNMRFGTGASNAGAYPILAATNGQALALNAIRFEVKGGTSDRGCLVRAKDSTVAVTGTGSGHHGIYLSGTVDADFDNCLVGGTSQISKLNYGGDSAGTMRFCNGSVLSAFPTNTEGKADYAVTLVFDDAEWNWGGGDKTLRYVSSLGEGFFKSSSSNRRFVTMEGTGVILKPNANCTFTTEVPFKGTGGLVSAGEGTVKFTGGAMQFTGLLDIRSGTVDLTAANARESLTVRGPGTLKGGEITTLTISETFEGGVLSGAPVLDGVAAGRVVIDFGRDESSPMDECENVLVATYPVENPPTIGRWTVSGTGITNVKGLFTVSGGEVRASVKQFGFMMIIR